MVAVCVIASGVGWGSMATSLRRCGAAVSTVVSVTPSSAIPAYSVRLGENWPMSTPLIVSETATGPVFSSRRSRR